MGDPAETSVEVAAVADRCNPNFCGHIVDRVSDSIVADANRPDCYVVAELVAASSARIEWNPRDSVEHPQLDLLREIANVAFDLIRGR